MGPARAAFVLTRAIAGPAGTGPCLGLPDHCTMQTQAVETRVNCSISDRLTVQSVQVLLLDNV